MQEVATRSTVPLVTQDFSREKIDLIKQTVAKGTTDLELELFLHACKRTGLDPLMKQIYAIKRHSNKTNTDEMSIQTGIDGYRLIADRTGQYAGSDEPAYLLGEDGYPDVASVTVYKLVGSLKCAFSSSARWKEYVQKSGPMWEKMPFLMLAKCAEALALRKAFPAELSGVYTHEEMMQADMEPRKPLRTPSQILAESEQAAADGLDGTIEAKRSASEPIAPVNQDALPPNYSEMIDLSETIKETSDTLNAMEKDDRVDLFTKPQLREQGKQKILQLRAKKG